MKSRKWTSIFCQLKANRVRIETVRPETAVLRLQGSTVGYCLPVNVNRSELSDRGVRHFECGRSFVHMTTGREQNSRLQWLGPRESFPVSSLTLLAKCLAEGILKH